MMSIEQLEIQVQKLAFLRVLITSLPPTERRLLLCRHHIKEMH